MQTYYSCSYFLSLLQYYVWTKYFSITLNFLIYHILLRFYANLTSTLKSASNFGEILLEHGVRWKLDFAQVKLLFHFTKLVVFYLWHRKFIITYLKCNPAAGPILHTNLFKEQLVFIWTLRNQNNSRKVPPWKTPTWKILIYQTPIW